MRVRCGKGDFVTSDSKKPKNINTQYTKRDIRIL